MIRRRPHGDGGATLLIVLVFFMLVSVLALTLLNIVQTNYETTDAVQQSRQSNYATDAATELAISNLINDPSGDLGTPYGPKCEFTMASINGRSSTVTCEPVAGSGEYDPNRAINALLSLSESASEPLTLSGTAKITIDGRVYSNSGIDADNSNNSEFRSTATVTAEGDGDCSDDARVVGVRLKTCNAASARAGDDPGWSPANLALDPVTGLVPVGTAASDCPGLTPPKPKRHIVTFTPGVYKQSPTQMMDAACSSVAVLHFAPGTYYFEDVDFDLFSHRVVAGTADPGVIANPESYPTGSVACDPTKPGAQFILGGTSRIHASSPSNEPVLSICGPAKTATEPSIAVYGLSKDTGVMRELTSGVALSLNNKPNVFVHGSVYIPTSHVRLTLHNSSRTLYRGGVVAYTFEAAVNASSTQADSPISLPDCTAPDPCRTDRRVLFTARVNAGAPALRSVVDFAGEQGGLVLPPPNDLEQWNNLP